MEKEAPLRKLHFVGGAAHAQATDEDRTRESDIYYVLASFIEVDGRPYSLELVKRTKSDDMFERENVLNQLLVRNRQVYMDSVTKVYNRRYYDERLKNLEAGSRSP